MIDRFNSDKICPVCGAMRMRSWDKLDEEQKLLVSKLAASAEFTPAERHRRRFCTRCWYEETGDEPRTA